MARTQLHYPRAPWGSEDRAYEDSHYPDSVPEEYRETVRRVSVAVVKQWREEGVLASVDAEDEEVEF